MTSLLRALTPGIMNDRDSLHRITSSKGEIESCTQYNYEITGHSEGKSLPEDLRREFKYGGNWYYLSMELERRGYKVEFIHDRHL